jgi:hypothetical protein
MNFVKAVDSRVNLDAPTMVVYESTASVQYQTLTTPTSSDNITIVIPITPGLGLSRQLMMNCQLQFTITGTNLNNFVNANCLSLRAMPVNQSISALNIQLGTNGVQIQPNLYTSAFLQYNNETYAQRQNQSGTASAVDTCATYQTPTFGNTIVGSVGSPFGSGWEEDNSSDVNTVRTKQITNFVVAGDGLSATFNVNVTEALIASPFTYESIADPKKAIFNLSNVIVTASFSNVASRFLSYAVPVGSTVTGITYNWAAPQQIFCEFVAPFEDSISNATRPSSYNYTFIQSSDTQLQALPAGGSVSVTTNTLQLSIIPNAFLIYAIPMSSPANDTVSGRPVPTLNSTAVSCADMFFPITNINVQFGEKQGLLGQASQYQLWSISKKNGSNVDFPRWTGAPVNSSMGNYGNYSGGVLILNTAQDLGLPTSTCAGMVYPSNFTANITVTNQTGYNYPAGCILRVVALTDGWIQTAGAGNVDIHVGSITRDMLNASTMPEIEDEIIRSKSRRSGYSGGRYTWNDFKHDMSSFANYISPISKPIIGALTNKAVQSIQGAGKMNRGKVRGLLKGYF